MRLLAYMAENLQYDDAKKMSVGSIQEQQMTCLAN